MNRRPIQNEIHYKPDNVLVKTRGDGTEQKHEKTVSRGAQRILFHPEVGIMHLEQ